MTDAEIEAVAIAASLTKAQKRVLLSARFWDEDGPHWPAGYYLHGDKRCRYALCRAGLTTDYLPRSNRLTPLGVAVLLHMRNTEGGSHD